jgi:hypothetical protein
MVALTPMEKSSAPSLHSLTGKIQEELYRVAGSFLYIGYLLWEAKEDKYYLEGGYSDIYAYAQAELGFKKSSTCNFINVCLKFSERAHPGDPKPTYQITNEFKKFSYSQLCEMLSMSDKQHELVSSEMTVKEIREIKKFDSDPVEDTIVQTSGQKDDVYCFSRIYDVMTTDSAKVVFKEIDHWLGEYKGLRIEIHYLKD